VAEVTKVIKDAANKQCELDVMPTWLLKDSVTLLAPYITTIMNASLTSGQFPTVWKHAIVTPLLKKSGLDESLPSSFRPVSNLSFLSKILERTVHRQLSSHLLQQNLFPQYQSAYRNGHSTETALLKVFSDIVDAVDAGNLVLLSLLDMSAAFDTVDHEILLERLSRSYGANSHALQWLQSYLTGRTQSVRLAGDTSAPRRVTCGVPQGSVLGPLLFVLYTADIGRVIEAHGLLHHCYADDTQLYFQCRRADSGLLKNRVIRCIAELTDWMAQNRVKLNPSKSEFLWCTSARCKQQLSDESFVLVDGATKPSSQVRNLGIIFDNTMSMSAYVNQLVSSCFYQLRRIRAIRCNVSTSSAVKLVNSFVVSRVDCYNSLLLGLPEYQLKRIQSVMNAAACLIYGKTRRDHVSPLLHKLHWLRVPERLTYKACLLVYKALRCQAPSYIADYCVSSTSVQTRYHLRSSADQSLDVPRTRLKFGERSFRHAGPTAWNSLPMHVKSATSVDVFKSRLKTHLFKLSHGCN